MIKLKPCPFCGGEAKLYRYAIDEYLSAEIKCKTCESGTKRFFDVNNDGMFITNLIEAWNRRVDKKLNEELIILGSW